MLFMEIFWGAWFANGYPASDARSLDSAAMNILWGRGLAGYVRMHLYYSYRVPLYPIFLSMIYRFFGHEYLIARIVQCIISAATASVIYLIAVRLYRQKAVGIIAGVTAALYLPFIYYAYCLLTETLFIFFLTVSVLLLIEATQKRSLWTVVTAGVCCALAGLTRAAMMCLIPFFILWLIIAFRREIKTLLRLGIGFMLATIVVVSPWLIRNYAVHGRPFFATTGMRHLWNGADPKYEGSSYSRPAWREALWMNPRATEAERVAILTPKAFGYISKYPILYLQFCFKRMNFLWIYPNHFQKLKLSVVGVMDCLPAFVIPLGLLGLVFSLRRWRQAFLLGGIVVTYSIFHGIFGGTGRFRVPLDWIFIVCTAHFLISLISIGKTPLLAACHDEKDYFGDHDPERKTKHRWLRYTAAGLAAIVIAAYIIMVLPQYLRKKEPFAGYEPDTIAVEAMLKKVGLYDRWVEQGKPSYTVDDIIDMRVAGGDIGGKYPDWIIVWSGELRYIVRGSDGRISDFNFNLNAGGQHLGDGKFGCTVTDEAVIEIGDVEEGMVATVVGYTANEMIGAPHIMAVGIIPYEK